MADIKQVLLDHAVRSTSTRQIANWADQLGSALRKLNDGPVYDHERDRLIQEAACAYDRIKEFMEPSDG